MDSQVWGLFGVFRVQAQRLGRLNVVHLWFRRPSLNRDPTEGRSSNDGDEDEEIHKTGAGCADGGRHCNRHDRRLDLPSRSARFGGHWLWLPRLLWRLRALLRARLLRPLLLWRLLRLSGLWLLRSSLLSRLLRPWLARLSRRLAWPWSLALSAEETKPRWKRRGFFFALMRASTRNRTTKNT